MLSELHKKQFVIFYLICFVVNFYWCFDNDLLMSQNQPLIFVNSLDLTRNLLMLSNIQHSLVTSSKLCFLFDLVYFLCPFILSYTILKNTKGQSIMSLTTSIVAFVYGIFYSMFSYFSFTYFISLVFIPLIFYKRSDEGFYFNLHFMRLIFLGIFVSTGFWKIRTGAVFNIEQMSSILLQQHKQVLINEPEGWYSLFIFFMIKNRIFSYMLYLSAVLIEISFAIGFFTKRYDNLLFILFCIFLLMDFFIMQINYFNWFVFSGLFYYSKFNLSKQI